MAKLRIPAEGVFGYLKQVLGYRRVRYIGLVKGETDLLLKAVVYNIRGSLHIRLGPSEA